MKKLMLIALLILIVPMASAFTQDDSPYGDTYTPEELAALDEALWAGNMTREDMHFKKDYTEGYGCFPIVREMMDDPLRIAPWMDQISEGVYRLGLNSYLTVQQAMQSTGYSIYLKQIDGAGSNSKDLTPDMVSTLIQSRLETLYPAALSPEQLTETRSLITTSMAWHDFEGSDAATGYENAKSESDASPYDLFKQVGLIVPETAVDTDSYAASILDMFFALQKLHMAIGTKGMPVLDQPYYSDTSFGRICIGTPGDDYYEGDFVVLIEPGGNDVYHNCRIGAAYGQRSYGPRLGPDGEPTGASADYSPLGDGTIGYFCDLGGDDFYDCADVDITLGAAVLGVAAFYDLGGGNDRYYGGFCSLGAAMGGVATFYDDGGCDYYSGKAYTQGAAGFGIGIMLDDSVADAPVFDTAEGNDGVIDSYETGESDADVHSQMDNDYYTAWAEAQAFARPRGVALCINRRGNEVYHAGGVYLHAPLFSDRYQSFSQGFAIGERDIDWAGGIAMLIDYEGNDRYLGDIYNQGVGYWYGAGLLWDGAGNDTYEMTQYGQGSGIHLAIGGLVDGGGNDTYVMHSGLGQGGSHDLAASILHDRGGDDHYLGMTTCNGAALTGSVGLHIDRSGNDTYAGRRNSGVNHTDGRRHNIGVLVDCAGDDDYLGIQDNGLTSVMRNISMTADIAPPPVEAAEEETEAAVTEEEAGADVPVPEICSYEGELTQEVFDELWEIAVRWEVGDNRYIVPHARERLIEFGPAVLPYLSEVMDDSNSGLALRAFVDIYKALWEVDAIGVGSVLTDNAHSTDTTRKTNSLYLIGEMQLTDLEMVVTGLLEDEDPALVRRAIGVLGKIGSHAADENLIDIIATSDDEPMLSAALTTLTDLEVTCCYELQPLLSSENFQLREQTIQQIAKHWDTYKPWVLTVTWSNVHSCGVKAGVLEDLRSPMEKRYSPEWFGYYATDSAEREQQQQQRKLDRTRELRSLLAILRAVDDPEIVEDYSSARMKYDMLYVRGKRTVPFCPLNLGVLILHEDWGVRGDTVRVLYHWDKLATEDEELHELSTQALAAMREALAEETSPYVLAAMEAVE